MVPLYKGYSDSGKLNKVEQGFANFAPVKYSPPEVTNGDYPLILLTGSTLHHLGTGTRSSRAWRLVKFSPQDVVEIGESDAQKLAITDGDQVRVISPIGEVVSTVRISDALPEGMLFMPGSFPQTPVTRLFGISLDPEAKTPSLKACSVRIEKPGSNE
jgi:predicted molibdopterin-dependent oxidoreductase YjgC